MKGFKQGLLVSALVLSAQGVMACTVDGSEGFVPENNLKISVNQKRAGGLTEQQFNDAIDRVETIYAPLVAQEGGKLSISRAWDDSTVNAYAQRSGTTWQVNMLGGLARHETITPDGMSLVVCHEIGHHIGGAPIKASAWSSSWASNEGQADYFANLKCLRRVFLNDDNVAEIAKMDVPAALSAACNRQWSQREDQAICIRGGMAGDSVAKLFAALSNASDKPAKFETPDQKEVTKTNDNHPAYQCRLDTYFQGSLCAVDFNENVDKASEVKGTCHKTLGFNIGLRPSCWFKAKVL